MVVYSLLLTCFSGVAQQPSYFVLGKEVFANSHVYSLHMHSENVLYVTTNYGMYVYKNGEFEEITPSDDQHGSSLFSIAENEKGEVYCCNLAGQIFKIVDDHLELFVEVPDEYIGNSMEIGFSSTDDLVVNSKAYLRYSSQEWELLHMPDVGATLSMNSYDPTRILVPKKIKTEMLCLEGEVVTTISMDSTLFAGGNLPIHFPAFLNGTLISLDRQGFFVNHSANFYSPAEITEIRAYMQTEKNEIWGLNYKNGIREIHLEGEELVISSTILSEFFVSAISKSNNGTIYLGTFNKGIIVLPNMSSSVLSNEDEFFTGICSSSYGLMGIDREGSIYSVSTDGIDLLEQECALPQGNLMNVSGVDFGLISGYSSLVFDAKHKEVSGRIGLVKGVTKVDDSTAIVATSLGVFRSGTGASQFNWLTTTFDENWGKLSSVDLRCKSVAYDTQNQTLYYATQEGLVYIDSNGETASVLYEDKPIDCNYLSYDNGVIWCCTQAFGVLKIEDGKFTGHFDTTSGLLSNYIWKSQLYNEKLFVAHKSGFQIIDLKTNVCKFIGTAEGLMSGPIDDFVVYEGNILIVSKGKVILLPISEQDKIPDFSLVIPSIMLGDSILQTKRPVNLPYDQNHFVAKFDFRGIEFELEAVIQYRMIGLSNVWKELEAITNQLDFNALAPGSYQFEVRIKYGNFIGETHAYSFVIEQPFWQTWWFYSLLILITAGIVIVFYRVQLARTKKEQIRQLQHQKMKTDMLDSELKALRSQMNPHFIFNSLNSIQDLILREDKESSYDYIVLFAKLVRNTLNYSNTDFIPIEKELEFLDVYLSLEKLRFGDSFEYSITYEGTKGINVPSMLVQPFIENALIHGLIHRKGLKTLNITFKRTELLTCTVIDNGVGRAKANEIQKRQRGDHASFALTAIEQRMELLNQQIGEDLGRYEVTDLMDGDLAIGTRVEINIPFKKS